MELIGGRGRSVGKPAMEEGRKWQLAFEEGGHLWRGEWGNQYVSMDEQPMMMTGQTIVGEFRIQI
jgi:hypothetical protein